MIQALRKDLGEIKTKELSVSSSSSRRSGLGSKSHLAWQRDEAKKEAEAAKEESAAMAAKIAELMQQLEAAKKAAKKKK